MPGASGCWSGVRFARSGEGVHKCPQAVGKPVDNRVGRWREADVAPTWDTVRRMHAVDSATWCPRGGLRTRSSPSTTSGTCGRGDAPLSGTRHAALVRGVLRRPPLERQDHGGGGAPPGRRCPCGRSRGRTVPCGARSGEGRCRGGRGPVRVLPGVGLLHGRCGVRSAAGLVGAGRLRACRERAPARAVPGIAQRCAEGRADSVRGAGSAGDGRRQPRCCCLIRFVSSVTWL